ncbi:MAG: hypothetical protein BWX70_03039 [Verrucomicrobia bacterium ADurb.Bin070]|nr:MAG: hypothetical protein BWX70_03039 [Verrucomicrobia bacterium ADurb.Bin070]
MRGIAHRQTHDIIALAPDVGHLRQARCGGVVTEVPVHVCRLACDRRCERIGRPREIGPRRTFDRHRQRTGQILNKELIGAHVHTARAGARLTLHVQRLRHPFLIEARARAGRPRQQPSVGEIGDHRRGVHIALAGRQRQRAGVGHRPLVKVGAESSGSVVVNDAVAHRIRCAVAVETATALRRAGHGRGIGHNRTVIHALGRSRTVHAAALARGVAGDQAGGEHGIIDAAAHAV